MLDFVSFCIDLIFSVGTVRFSCMKNREKDAKNRACIATGTWYNARVSKSPCEYRNGAVTFYFAELERARDQKELPY